MSEIGEKIKRFLLNAIEKDTLVLPTLPEIALNVREISENEDSGIADLIEVINKDTALSARILKVSNSPLFRGANEISDLNMAVGRLGMQYTSSLATGLAMEQMFQATTDLIDERMREVWKRSTEVAGVANVLSRKFAHLNTGQATLAGLVYPIGALPVLKFIEDKSLRINATVLDKLLDELQPIIGEKILEHWEFPQELRKVPKQCVNFKRTIAQVDYADLVQVGMLQTYIGSDHPYLELDWHSISAFERVGMEPSKEADEEDLDAEMAAAMAMLNAG